MPRLHVRDLHLYYDSTGQGHPLLFIHGLGSSTRDWEFQVPFFAQNYQVVTYDLRGHGQSDKPPGPYSMRLFAEDTAALLQALGCAPAHVVGLSLGGMIAFELAVSAPELVRSLVIVNSGPEVPIPNFKARLRVLINYLQRLFIVRVLGMRRMGQVLSKRLLPGADHAELRRVFVERWAENDKDAYLAALRAMGGWSVSDRLHTISCPTLVIAADQDYTPVSFKEWYVARMPHAELAVLADARHYAAVERPQQFNEVLMAFLRKHGREEWG